jgi:hypothetical protein
MASVAGDQGAGSPGKVRFLFILLRDSELVSADAWYELVEGLNIS